MNIKNRLFLSNLLMIIMPVILISLVLPGLMLIFSGVVRTHDFKTFSVYFESIKEFEEYAAKWDQNPDIEKMKLDVDSFNKKYLSVTKTIYIFHNGEFVYPEENNDLNFDLSMYKDDVRLIVADGVATFRERAGEYDIILLDTDFLLYRVYGSANYDDVFLNYGILTFMVIVIIIYFTNHLLIRFVFSEIEISLDSLANGVNQIRDGNLNYRIKYEKNNEFAQICSDFNEMAIRLLDSVNAKQKDEANRRELIAGISHDLRTPLTSIKAYVEGLEKGVASTPETQKRYLSIIQKKTDDLTHIVNQLFMFSKLDIGEFPLKIESIDIGDELNSFLCDVSEEYAEKGVIVFLQENLSNVYIDADTVLLRNAFGNILENTLKYKDRDIGEIKVTCVRSGKNVAITFIDNGPGIRDGDEDKIFQLFYQSDPSRSNSDKGSGLGLAITAKILEQLGGGVKAENSLSGGLAIIMTVPVKYILSEEG